MLVGGQEVSFPKVASAGFVVLQDYNAVLSGDKSDESSLNKCQGRQVARVAQS